MKKKFFFIIILIIPFWVLAYTVADNGIEFDPMIESYLQKEFETTNLSKKFAHSVESLDLSNLNLTSTKGLEHFINLKELNLSKNLLSDSAFLNNLENLEKLDLSFNQFEDIELGSSKIETLDLEANRLTSIDFVASLNNLSKLNLRANNVLDLSPLEGMENLHYLNIRGNRVKSLEPLASLKTLMNLNVRNNQINSIEPIVELPLNDRLFLTGNDINDLKLLEDRLTSIEDIDFEIEIPKPMFSVESGVYDEIFYLELETEEGHEIYYTLDGSFPNAQSNKYESPIEISKDVMNEIPIISNNKTSLRHEGFSFESKDVKKGVTVTAVSAIKKHGSMGRTFSKPKTKTYIFDSNLFTSNLPVISLTMDPFDLFDFKKGIYIPGIWYEEDSPWSGNFAQKGREHEKNATIELFQQDGLLAFQQDIGIRINGRATRSYPQKSLRLYSRSDYGQSRFYTDIFNDLPYNEFNLLILRNSGNDYYSTLIRDALMHELIKDQKVDVQAYQPTILLLNGEYWGIHNLREKFTEDYLDIKYNVKDQDLILMKVFKEGDSVDFDMKVGTQKDKLSYFQVLDFVEENDMTENKNVHHLDTLIDIDNFFHYVAYQVYYVNTDSFSNNLMVWRKKSNYSLDAPDEGHDGRWRWMLFDLDFGMGLDMHVNTNYEGNPVEYNMIKHVLADEERMKLFRELMKNKDAQDRFIKIMLTLLNNNFEPTHVKDKIDELADKIRPEIPQSITRWENIESVEKWEDNIQVLRNFADERPEFIKQHMMEEFGFTEDEIKKIEKSN